MSCHHPNHLFTRVSSALPGAGGRRLATAIDDGSIQTRIIMLPLKPMRGEMSELRQGFVELFCRQDSGVVIGGVVITTTASELILPIRDGGSKPVHR